MTVSQPVERVVDCLSTAGYRERESKTAGARPETLIVQSY